MSNRVKIESFQGLRGIAFLLIFISHCTFSTNEQGINSTSYFGAFGVSIFIILSGFLTVYNHYDSKELSATRQISKMINKCYPLHFLTFLLSAPLLLKELIKPNIKTWIISAINLALIQSWVPKRSVYFSNNAVSWYLSTYLFLMLISPFIVRYLKQATSTKIISLLLINLSIQVSLVLFTGGYSWAHWLIYICPITRSLDFISGGGIAILIKRCSISKCKYILLFYFGCIVSLITMVYSASSDTNNMLLVVLWSLPSYAIIAGLFGMEQEKVSKLLFQNYFISHLGKVSLELFLIHQLVIRYVEIIARKLNLLSAFMYVIALLITIMVATALHELNTRRMPHG